ncbi:hypothetical protein B0A48_13273 [Cryoendolithus antarcticus]|uniref:Uncharacterized protein n=1 Tax=Cryoendolithus antarcticus TaxID=1507870 RepID=A0A1V8SPP4_9PEZI|nr:hypothetical protein B0A48_13273 [Cryoendolithus antarcticus]
MPPINRTIKQHGSVPWTSHTRIGAGFDPSSHEVLASPFFGIHIEEDSDNDDDDEVTKTVGPEQPVTFALHDEVFADAVRLGDYLESWISGPGPPLSVEQMRELGEYVSSLTCGRGRVVHVLRGTITEEARQFHEELLLTPQAKALLAGDVGKFTASYGEYFITGYVRQASFVAISSYAVDESCGLTRSATGLSLSSEKSNANGGMVVKGSKDTGAARSCKVLASGLRTGNDLALAPDSDLTKAWEDFRGQHELVPQLALLEHYSGMLPGQIARPTRAVTLGFDASSALWQCAVLQMLSRSLSVDSRTTTGRLEVIYDQLDTHTRTRASAENLEAEKLIEELNRISASLRDMARNAKHKTTLRAELDVLSAKQEAAYPE